MTLVLALVGLPVGLLVAVLASQRSLHHALGLSQSLGLSRFVIGVTVVAIGTDLPEIANSMVSSATGHGGVNVGDSIGSTVTQITLMVGLLCLTGRLQGDRAYVMITGGLTVGTMLIGIVLMADDYLSHTDGLTLVALWLVGTLYVGSRTRLVRVATVERADIATTLAMLVGSLALVGGGAFVAVESFVELADRFGLPEYLTSFFVLSLGTSLPELVVDYQALRRGESGLALGDLLGSSFVDATLSVGIGPLFFPVGLEDGVIRTGLISTVVVLAAVALLARTGPYRRSIGVSLIALYGLLYLTLLT